MDRDLLHMIDAQGKQMDGHVKLYKQNYFQNFEYKSDLFIVWVSDTKITED